MTNTSVDGQRVCKESKAVWNYKRACELHALCLSNNYANRKIASSVGKPDRACHLRSAAARIAVVTYAGTKHRNLEQ